MRRRVVWSMTVLAALLSSCGPPGPSPVAAAEVATARSPSARTALPLSWMREMFGRTRASATMEVTLIAGVLPAGRRDIEVAWLLRRPAVTSSADFLDALDIPECVRHRAALRQWARAEPCRAGDSALVALARAGEIDVLAIVLRGLRLENDEQRLVALAAAAQWLAPLVPASELANALRRARTPRAVIALVTALGDRVSAADLHDLARGRTSEATIAAFGTALAAARRPSLTASFGSIGLDRARCRALLDGADDPASSAELARLARIGITRFALERMLGGDRVLIHVDPRTLLLDAPVEPVSRPLAIDALHVRAREIMREDGWRTDAVVADLEDRIRGASCDAVEAARCLGEIATTAAVSTLAAALYETSGESCAAVSTALRTALGIAPERSPENLIELRRAWEPILASLLFIDRGYRPAPLTEP